MPAISEVRRKAHEGELLATARRTLSEAENRRKKDFHSEDQWNVEQIRKLFAKSHEMSDDLIYAQTSSFSCFNQTQKAITSASRGGLIIFPIFRAFWEPRFLIERMSKQINDLSYRDQKKFRRVIQTVLAGCERDEYDLLNY